MEKGFFEKVAEICIDSEGNVVVNRNPGISKEKMINLLQKSIDVVEHMQEEA